MNATRRALTLIAILSLTVAACGGAGTVEAAGVQLAGPAEVESVIEADAGELVVLDIRTPEEFAGGHLEGATMIDFYAPDFADRIDDLPRDIPYVMYCRSGNRSQQAARMMRDLGFSEVYEIDGGIQAWLRSGLPVTTG